MLHGFMMETYREVPRETLGIALACLEVVSTLNLTELKLCGISLESIIDTPSGIECFSII